MTIPLHDQVTESALSELRDGFQKKLFGNRYRLEVLVAVSRAEEPFYVREIALSAGIGEVETRRVLLDLAESGLLKRVSETRGARVYYERVRSSVWPLFEPLLREAVSSSKSA